MFLRCHIFHCDKSLTIYPYQSLQLIQKQHPGLIQILQFSPGSKKAPIRFGLVIPHVSASGFSVDQDWDSREL